MSKDRPKIVLHTELGVKQPTDTRCTVLGFDQVLYDRIKAEEARLEYLKNLEEERQRKAKQRASKKKRKPSRAEANAAKTQRILNEENPFRKAFKKGKGKRK
jgi:hypothetical protein